MRIRWRNLELPTRVVSEETSETYGRFVAEPFERGFGTTVGNGLRRVLHGSPGLRLGAAHAPLPGQHSEAQ